MCVLRDFLQTLIIFSQWCERNQPFLGGVLLITSCCFACAHSKLKLGYVAQFCTWWLWGYLKGQPSNAPGFFYALVWHGVKSLHWYILGWVHFLFMSVHSLTSFEARFCIWWIWGYLLAQPLRHLALLMFWYDTSTKLRLGCIGITTLLKIKVSYQH